MRLVMRFVSRTMSVRQEDSYWGSAMATADQTSHLRALQC